MPVVWRVGGGHWRRGQDRSRGGGGAHVVDPQEAVRGLQGGLRWRAKVQQ